MDKWNQQLIDEFNDAAEGIEMAAKEYASGFYPEPYFEAGMLWAADHLRKLAISIKAREPK